MRTWSYFQRRKRYGIVNRLRYWAKMQYWRVVRAVHGTHIGWRLCVVVIVVVWLANAYGDTLARWAMGW